MDIVPQNFDEDFKWGVSTAAYQIEGAHDSDGKGKSIWDVFVNTKGKIANSDTGNLTTDFYHRYAKDIALMSQLKIPNFRFSISWSRILPLGIGAVNPKGIEFYNKVIDFCLDLDIEPWITLYHWDLPYELEKKGGWTNREVINWFANYVEVCMRHFGNRVTHWMILNEPMVFTGAGYLLGVHAPGRKGLKSFLPAMHHAALCQAEGARVVKSLRSNCKVGTTFSCSYIQPRSPSLLDVQAAKKVDALLNRSFIEPLLGKGYPTKDIRLLQRLEPFVKDGDESKLAFDMDFIGVQNYTREVVGHSYFTPIIWSKILRADKRKVPTTLMNWEVYPACIYHMLHQFNAYKNIPQLIVTENGAAFKDLVVNGQVHDTERKEYLQQHIWQVLKAKQEGVNVNGYFAWSFTDNFEWAEGYRPRFGLVYVDYTTQKRIVKSSGYWYSKLLQNFTNHFDLKEALLVS